MKQLQEYSKLIIEWLTAQGVTQQDIQVFVLLLALIALFASVSAARKARDIAGGVGLQHMRDKLDKALIQFGDTRAKLEGENERLKEKISRLERELTELREDEAKKKTTESRVEQEAAPVPAPEAAPETAPASSIFSGLKKTRDVFFTRLNSIFSKRPDLSAETFEELEELLITGDLGVKTTQRLLAHLREQVQAGAVKDGEECRRVLQDEVRRVLEAPGPREIVPEKRDGKPEVILVVGVNGVGKTTTIGKLASRFAKQGSRVLLGAADTFRAAAAEQIEIWAERADVSVLRGAENAKPSTVAYEALHKGMNEGFDCVIIDTAGRLHTRVNLMNELGGVIELIDREQPGAPHETILVVDATTGQNALEQAKEFHQRAKLTGVVVTKLDGTPKGGIVVAICNELNIPVRYVGVGESAADLKPFSAAEFAEALFAEGSEPVFTAAQPKAALRAVRRRGNS